MDRGTAPAVWLPTIRAGTGADVFTQRLRDGLVARGIRAEISWLPHRAEYLPWTVPVPSPPDWANIVHVNSWLPRRFWPEELPVIVTVHHLVHDPAYRPFRTAPQTIYHRLLIRSRELQAIRGAAAVTAVSDYVKRTVIAFSGREDIAVIHNWIDGDVFMPGAGSRVRGARPFRLFMAGSHSRRKGYDLLPAFAQALGPGFEIRCAGGKAGSESFAVNVIEVGKISEADLIREYRECDAVVSLSRYEGFGYTALEGMACGKPFIGFRSSGLIEVVEEGKSGFLFDMHDMTAMVAKCQELATNLPLLGDMAFAARHRAVMGFQKMASVHSYIAIYERLLKQGSAKLPHGSN